MKTLFRAGTRPRRLWRRSSAWLAFCVAVAMMVCGAPASAAVQRQALPSAVRTGVQIAPYSAASAHWTWPVDPPWRIVRGFRAPPTPYAAGHRGIDLAADAGGAVYAPADGVVSFAGKVVDRSVLSITLPGGVIASSEPIAATVQVGERVYAGEKVGSLATGGHCDGACLHFGVRVHGEYVSPLLFLARVQRAVLLPLAPRER